MIGPEAEGTRTDQDFWKIVQHYRTTQRYPTEQALSMQQARDLMKEALCVVVMRSQLRKPA